MHSAQVGLIICSGALLLGACASGRGGGGGDEARANDGVSMADGAVVLTRAALTERSGNVITAMRGRVPNFRVIRDAVRECPQISLRNDRTDFMGRVINPQVYVDGTRTTDTCILESIRSEEVERVEVYPQGFTNRPGYARHSSGLILLFLRSS